MDAITFEAHFDADLAEADICDRLQDWLRDHSPRFASGLRVLSYERDPDAVFVDVSVEASLHRAMVERGSARGATFDELGAQGPPVPYARRFGKVMLRGKAPKSFLGLRFDQFHPGMPMGDKWLWSNSVSGHIETHTIDRLSAAEWVGSLLETLAQHPALLWAAAYASGEWHARNMHDEPDGMWAIGRDVRQSLPGLFWLNVFGKPYVDHIGRPRLLSVPSDLVMEIGEAVLIRIDGTPAEWATDGSRSAREVAADHLGAEHFFDRRFPERRLSTPDLGLAEREKPGRALQVLMPDGDHFTVLPPTT